MQIAARINGPDFPLRKIRDLVRDVWKVVPELNAPRIAWSSLKMETQVIIPTRHDRRRRKVPRIPFSNSKSISKRRVAWKHAVVNVITPFPSKLTNHGFHLGKTWTITVKTPRKYIREE
jgi:hypothetical protein